MNVVKFCPPSARGIAPLVFLSALGFTLLTETQSLAKLVFEPVRQPVSNINTVLVLLNEQN